MRESQTHSTPDQTTCQHIFEPRTVLDFDAYGNVLDEMTVFICSECGFSKRPLTTLEQRGLTRLKSIHSENFPSPEGRNFEHESDPLGIFGAIIIGVLFTALVAGLIGVML